MDLEQLVDELATRVAAAVAERIASPPASPWMSMEEAIAYSRVPDTRGTIRSSCRGSWDTRTQRSRRAFYAICSTLPSTPSGREQVWRPDTAIYSVGETTRKPGQV